MPSPFGEDSELCRTLRLVAPRFEHRLFLSATPHNGHTRSFTGLLEMLDPVRFTRTAEMTDAMRRRADDVVIRRLKREINAGSSAPRFCHRNPPKSLRLDFDPRESALSQAFDAFRHAVRRLVADGTTRTPPRRHLRRRDSGQAAAVVSHRLRGVLAPGATGVRRTGGRPGTGPDGSGTSPAPGDRGRPGNAAARGDRRNRGGRMAQELRRRSERRDARSRPRARRPRLRSRRTARGGADARRGRALRHARRLDRAAPATRQRIPRRRTPDRLHRVQDHARLPGTASARALSGRPRAHAVRRGRAGRHDRPRPGQRQSGVQRPGVVGARSGRHRRGVRGTQPASHRSLPPPLRLPLEPVTAGAAQRPPGPLRPGPRRDGASLRQ